MKVKLSCKKKSKLNEIEPVTMAIGAFLSFILGMFFTNLKVLNTLNGNNLEKGSNLAKEGVKQSPIPEQVKNDFLQKFDAAEQDLRNTLNELQQKRQDISRKQRPSAIIAEKVRVLLMEITQLKNNYKNELAKSPEATKKIDEAIKFINSAFTNIANLDLISAISSKEDPNGLWKSLDPKFTNIYKDEQKWLMFASELAASVQDAGKFKTAQLPTA